MNTVHFYYELIRKIAAKNGFLDRESIAKFDFLPRNYREIRYFYREITAKLTILQFRGTAKLGMNYRAKYRPLL